MVLRECLNFIDSLEKNSDDLVALLSALTDKLPRWQVEYALREKMPQMKNNKIYTLKEVLEFGYNSCLLKTTFENYYFYDEESLKFEGLSLETLVKFVYIDFDDDNYEQAILILAD